MRLNGEDIKLTISENAHSTQTAFPPFRSYFTRKRVIPVLGSALQRKGKSEGFNYILITPSPPGGSVDKIKFFQMLNRVFTRNSMKLRKQNERTFSIPRQRHQKSDKAPKAGSESLNFQNKNSLQIVPNELWEFRRDLEKLLLLHIGRIGPSKGLGPWPGNLKFHFSLNFDSARRYCAVERVYRADARSTRMQL
ncbi:hypothetical protein PIB30_072501 [Stylosanthes scabra]|uniref:Ribosomal protein S10 n=1 Tax=Stylosanthes scabra TaxID=79078 RepID=A0ABU6YMZ2_9FABA|nr:hypothetical protein [Stylosanthes scabra]